MSEVEYRSYDIVLVQNGLSPSAKFGVGIYGNASRCYDSVVVIYASPDPARR
jgi:hypothetical protein